MKKQEMNETRKTFKSRIRYETIHAKTKVYQLNTHNNGFFNLKCLYGVKNHIICANNQVVIISINSY